MSDSINYPEVGDVYKRQIEKRFGADKSRSLFQDNPMRVLRNEDIGMTT